MPRATLKESDRPAVNRVRRAHAVCEGVLSPFPAHARSAYDKQDSPHPPSIFCLDSTQETARRIQGADMSSPIA